MGTERGTYTFLYTDIEASSSAWESDPVAMRAFVSRLNELTSRIIENYDGKVFKSLGDGLACVFDAPHLAIQASIEIQRSLLSADLPKIRIGVHAGYAEKDDIDFHGTTLNRVSRITNLGHGGQILTSAETYNLARDHLASDVSTLDLGEQPLTGHQQRAHIFQVFTQDLPCSFPRLRGARREAHIPGLDRVFVGRARERADLLERLSRPEQRLITILGFGGMGKTTLAQVCALEVADAFADGVWWIPCEGLTTEDQLVAAISTVLDLPIDPGNPVEGLCGRIDEKSLLLVCDCFEALAKNGVGVDQLLRNCPNLQVLATSRIILGSPFEFEFELRGLVDLQRKRPNLNDAIELFANAAKQAKNDFEVTKGNRKLVSDLVRDLESIPLAIILVASRLRHRTLEELATQVKTSILEAARTLNGKAGRHSNLWRVIDMSFGLLAEEEQEVLTKLSVFCGGFYLDDAEAVLEVDDLVGKVSRLRDNSMVLADESGGKTRYRQLDSIKEYTSEVIDQDLFKELKTRHSMHYLSTANQVREHFEKSQWRLVSSILSVEGANLRQAIQAAVQERDQARILQYGKTLVQALAESGLVADFNFLASEAYNAACLKKDHQLKFHILGVQGISARRAGLVETAYEKWEKRRLLSEDIGDALGQADSLGDMLGLALQQGDASKVRELLAQYEALNPTLIDKSRIEHGLLRARCDSFLGNINLTCKRVKQIEQDPSFEVVSQSSFFVLGSLAVLHREIDQDRKSIFFAKKMLALAIESDFAPFAGQALLEMARTFDKLGELAALRKSLLAAMAIPKNSSPGLQENIRLTMKDLTNKISNVDQSEIQANWILAAKQTLIESIDP